MEFDLNEATETVEALLPWDLKLKVDGHAWPTRRPTIGDIAALQSLGDITRAAKDAKSDDAENAARADRFYARVASIFLDPQPPVREWQQDYLVGAVVAYLCYFNGQAPKKMKAIAESVKAAMADR